MANVNDFCFWSEFEDKISLSFDEVLELSKSGKIDIVENVDWRRGLFDGCNDYIFTNEAKQKILDYCNQ